MSTDVLIVSLGATPGLRAADADLAAAIERAGATTRTAVAVAPREVRTFALTDLAWALAARRAARAGIAEHRPRAIVYSSTTAALLWPQPGAIRFDALAAANRPGRHGIWQRALERRRLAAAGILVPWSPGALEGAPAWATECAITLPPVVEPSGPPGGDRDVAAVTYGSAGPKKGLDRVLAAWESARRPGETLVVVGVEGSGREGVRFAGRVGRDDVRALLRRARIFVSAPVREDFGITQLEALADGCVLVAAPEPDYVAMRIARVLDARMVSADLTSAIRTGLDDPRPGYAQAAAPLLAGFSRERTDATVRDALLPALLG